METKKVNHLLTEAIGFISHRNPRKQKSVVIASIRLLLLMLSVFTYIQMPAQKIWEERKGCVRVQGNLAPGYLLSQKTVSAYVNGDMDLFFDNRVSFTGSAWGSFALNRKNETGIKANHAVFGGL